ncbi:MAG: hypothetical protein K940chlam9_01770 [Chlamydiae bacterium]|nr:hypothetical protein [Chlamydiota bacterium]
MELLVQEQVWYGLFFATLLVALSLYLGKRSQYWHLPSKPLAGKVSIPQTVGAFLLYIFLTIVLAPLIWILIRGFLPDISSLSDYGRGWIQVSAALFLFGFMCGYLFLQKQEVQEEILGKFSWKSVGAGLGSLLLCYPFVFFLSVLGSIFSLLIWGEFELDQVAVVMVRKTIGHPGLFLAMVITVVFFVPIVEELLFRGFLQSVLRRYLGRSAAIILTAIFFALVHYAPSQGTGNLQLLLSLFALSFFLCYVYEREQSLYAPITTHIAFNALNVLFISI